MLLGSRSFVSSRKAHPIRAMLEDLRRDQGSISPLVITYFLISLLIVFIGINVTHTYLERRHLILTLEASLQRAAQQVDDDRYYTGYVEANTTSIGERGITTFLPVDCAEAKRVFDREFRTQWVLTRRNNLPDGDPSMARLRGGDAALWYGNPALKDGRIDDAPGGATTLSREDLWGRGSETSQRSVTSILHPPRIVAFDCDGRTLQAQAELMVELPFVISFAGVDFVRFSRQVAFVEVGLVLGG